MNLNYTFETAVSLWYSNLSTALFCISLKVVYHGKEGLYCPTPYAPPSYMSLQNKFLTSGKLNISNLCRIWIVYHLPPPPFPNILPCRAAAGVNIFERHTSVWDKKNVKLMECFRDLKIHAVKRICKNNC